MALSAKVLLTVVHQSTLLATRQLKREFGRAQLLWKVEDKPAQTMSIHLKRPKPATYYSVTSLLNVYSKLGHHSIAANWLFPECDYYTQGSL